MSRKVIQENPEHESGEVKGIRTDCHTKERREVKIQYEIQEQEDGRRVLLNPT